VNNKKILTNSQQSKIEILGFPFNALVMDEVIKIAEQHILSRKQLLLGVINVAKLINARRDTVLSRSLAEADLILADGLPIVWLSRLIGNPLPERVTGIDIMYKLLERSNTQRYRVYFLGAKEATVQKLVDIAKKEYPGLRVAGYRNGYFEEIEEQNIAKDIRNSSADILFVGMPSPKKEKFLSRWQGYMNVPVYHGVGGSFDVVAGVTKRAPIWLQRCGMEWFYRLIQEPRKMWKRYLVTNTIFLKMSLKEISFSVLQRVLPNTIRESSRDNSNSPNR
jgi:N-acetylglucosaminyldiphosphoundecaprenol N-acetyl-beta-D-mannosaminyltransferase